MNRRRFLQTATGAVGAAALPRTASARTAHGPFEPEGTVDIPGAREAVVHHDNEVVYVATMDGFAAVDISTPDEPTVLAERRGVEVPGGGQLQQVQDLWPWEDRLIIAGPANGPGRSAGVALYDITRPEQPQRVGFFQTEFAIHNSYFTDGLAYLTDNRQGTTGLVIVDMTDDDPEAVGRWSLADADSANGQIPSALQSLHDVSVHDDTAYLSYWDAGVWIVDVSDPTAPAALSRTGQYDLSEVRGFDARSPNVEAFTTPGNAHFAQVNDDGTVLAVGREAWALDTSGDGLTGGPGGVELYDVSDKTAPRQLARIDPPASYSQQRDGWFTTAHNLDLTNDRLYTSWYYGGVKIHDISDPANPLELAWWRNPEEAVFWTARTAGDVFVASSINAANVVQNAPNTTREALYVFHDEAGRQADPPSLEAPSTGESGAGGDADTDTGADTDADDGDGDGGADDGTTDGEDIDGSAADDGDNGPGFTGGAALAGIGGLAYLLGRRASSSDDEQS